jgi:hypothetical protein
MIAITMLAIALMCIGMGLVRLEDSNEEIECLADISEAK